MKTRVAVVIPNWNGADFIRECLSSLQEQTLKPHIMVVDNGSHDDSVAIIEEEFPRVELLKFKDNAGFAGGVNRGLKPLLEQDFDFIALFNNDAVADKNWLKNLVAAGQSKKRGIITGKFMRIDKVHIDSTGDQYSTRGMPFPRGRNHKDSGQYDRGEEVFSGTGGASLYRTSMLKEIGLFDEAFFAYFEDVDISFRAQLAGWKVWYEPTAIAYHHVSGTSSKLGDFARYHSIKNLVYLYDKNMPGWLFWKYKPVFLYQLLRIAAGALRDRKVIMFLKALSVVLTSMPDTLAKRHDIQKSRSVSPGYIDSKLYKTKPPKIPTL